MTVRRMTVRRWLWRFPNPRDDVGSVDALGFLCVFFAVEFK